VDDDAGRHDEITDENDPSDHEQDSAAQGADSVDLEHRLQIRNATIFASAVSLIYLAAPVLYVGFTQAALCERLGVSKTIANLPASAYLLTPGASIIAAWLIPQVRLLRRTISVAFLVTAAMGGVVAIIILLPGPQWDELRVASLIVHAVIVGASQSIVWAFNWEALARGVAESRRGTALTMAYGVGPIFAVVGSLGSQLLLTNDVFGWTPGLWRPISYPYNFALLFGSCVPLMGLAAYLVSLYVIPIVGPEIKRKSFVDSVLKGFGSFIANRLILITCIGYLLVYSAHQVQVNMVLFSQDAVGLPSEALVGYQNALRFGGKVLAGFLLGWILLRTNPLFCVALTTIIDALGVVWILFVRGMGFMVAFGLKGAGELFGVYYPNYIVSCSRKADVRRNMAFLALTSTPVAGAQVLWGWIADTWSLPTSFWVSIVVFVVTLALMVIVLPAHPHPPSEDDASSS